MWRKSASAVLALLLSAIAIAPLSLAGSGEGLPEPAPTALACASVHGAGVEADTQHKVAAKGLTVGASAVCPPPAATALQMCAAPVRPLSRKANARIRVASDWPQEQIEMMLAAVVRYEGLIGKPRFRRLVATALAMGGRQSTQLQFVRGADADTPAALWAPSRGQIVLRDALFDPAFVQSHYVWMAFLSWRHTGPEATTIQDAILAHEIGHVVVDALRAEQRAIDPDGLTLERLYQDHVERQFWPHADASVKENLATEFALLSLGIARPGGARVFRDEVMLPALAGTYWVSTCGAPATGTLLAPNRAEEAPRVTRKGSLD